MLMIWVPIVFLALIVGLGAFIWATSLSRVFAARLAEAATALPLAPAPLTEADIAALPPPVQRYIRQSGSLGRPMVTEITMEFEATMFDAPGAAGMTGPVRQYNRFDTPDRMFLMTTRMKGLPMTVLHDFSAGGATMKVRLAGLLNVVDLAGPDLTRTETVTLLNDLAFFAPSRLIDPRLSWTAIDDTHARVASTLGPNTVSAELVFNDAGELVDFISDDRGMLEKDGTLRILRWTTPMHSYLDFGGWRVATGGDAIWHLPEGPFTYGRMRLTRYAAK
jgi:hypothetical protein